VTHPLLTSLLTALLFAGIAALIVAFRVAGVTTPIVAEVGLWTFIGSCGVAAVVSWAQRARLRRRTTALSRAIVGLGANPETGGLPPLVEDEDLGEVARAVKVAAGRWTTQLQELTRDRARFEVILAGMVEGVLVVDAAGKVQLANDAARRLLRLESSPIGRHYLELVRHPEIAAQIGQALAGHTPPAVELSLSRDPSRTFLARSSPAGTSGRGVALVLHDITDLRRADRIRRDFVANVSHELRTPLTAIRGYVEALIDGPPRDAETQRFLEVIARHSSRMERLVKDLLRLARLDAGQETLELTSLSVDALYHSVVSDLAPAIEARRQKVTVRVAPDAATVGADTVKLHDVVRNLVENASNYSPEGCEIALSSEAAPGRVLLRIADTGPGIPEADLTRIFERFYRVDKGRSRESGGTGLGLSIVRHLVELHGGDVTAANRTGGGAVFTVSLPDGPSRTPLTN
jgi:two-component system phosphate regulon sensor histidine kinase PhoR